MEQVSNSLLSVELIKKSYRKREILKGVGLTANGGECIGIVGKNGCGKTTFLSILAGTVKPDGGSVRYGGIEATGHPSVFAKMAAYVPQENPLIEELSVRDNLLLWHRGNREAFRESLKNGTAYMLGIPDMLDYTVKKLSGGMKKRLSIACALTNHAPVLIMDEPGAALDLECKEIIRSYVKKYIEDGGLVLLASHELPELSLCTRTCILRDGGLHPVENGLSESELIGRF